MTGSLREDYESLVLSGVKRITDDGGNSLLTDTHQAALARLIPSGLAAREGDAFVLRRADDATVPLDQSARDSIETLHALWLRLDNHAIAEDEILYGELGYWQHWGNVLNDGTDRSISPLKMDILLPERGSLLSRQWTRDLDPEIVDYVFSNGLVNIRLLVPPAAQEAAIETMIEDALRRGAQVRVFPVALEFTLYDGAIAVLPDERSGEGLERHRLTRQRPIVEPLTHLFELRWAAAIPWESFVRGSGGVLQLLGQGWTDARIAEALGTSPRTVSRRIAEMMRSAGVQSRFELGMKYALQEHGAPSAESS